MKIRFPNPRMREGYFYECQHYNRVSLGHERHWCRDCGALRAPGSDARIVRQVKHHATGHTDDGFVWICPVRDGWPADLADAAAQARSAPS